MTDILFTPLRLNELEQLIQNSVEKALQAHIFPDTTKQPDKLLTIEKAAVLLSLTVPTMYSKVSKGELPVMKRGKRLYFSQYELDAYIMSGRKKTNAEIEAQADAYLSANDKVGRVGK